MENQQSQEQQKSGLNTKVIGILIAIIVVVILALWFTRGGEPEPQPAIEVPVAPTPVERELVPEPEPEPLPEPEPEPIPEPTPMPEPEPEPEPIDPLPAIDDAADTVLSELAAENVNTRPIIASNAFRKFVVLVDNVANGELVREAAVIEGPESRFLVQEIDGQLYIDERSYARYDEIVSWFYQLDNDVLVALYRRYLPLLEDAYSEFKEPGRNFNDRALDAIAVLLDTPEPRGLLAVDDSQVMYTYADPALESLSPAQKQMLRLGPDNRAMVKTKLRQLRQRLQ